MSQNFCQIKEVLYKCSLLKLKLHMSTRDTIKDLRDLLHLNVS